jgi:hypothetical protein
VLEVEVRRNWLSRQPSCGEEQIFAPKSLRASRGELTPLPPQYDATDGDLSDRGRQNDDDDDR